MANALTQHRTVLCIGSNQPDAMERVAHACNLVATTILTESEATVPYATRPEPPTDTSGASYANAVVSGSTTMDIEQLQHAIKKIEHHLGRTQNTHKGGEVIIDIDIVVFDNHICRHTQFEAYYFREGYNRLSHRLK